MDHLLYLLSAGISSNKDQCHDSTFVQFSFLNFNKKFIKDCEFVGLLKEYISMTSFWTLHVTFSSLHILAKRLFLAGKANSEFVVMLFPSYNLVFCPAQTNQ